MSRALEGSGHDGEPLEIARRAVERALAAGAAQADAIVIESDSHEARVRGEEIEVVKRARESGLGLRALVAGPQGFSTAVSSMSDLSREAIDHMASETVALARATASDAHAGLPEDGFAESLPELELADEADRHVDVEARIAEARRAERAARARDPRIDNSEGSEVGSDFAHVSYANSTGFAAAYDSAYHSLSSQPLAREGDAMQRDHWITVGRRLEDLEDAADVGRRAADRALRRLGARRVKTCEVPVIFDALTAPSLLGQLAACLSGYAIYRDSSFLAGRLGQTIAAGDVTLIDDGRRARGLGSKPFDGEGLPTRRTTLIRSGVLESWLLDTYSARKLGLSSTGNASRGLGAAPGVGSTNLWLEPGDSSLEQIIAGTERGLLVGELIGMGFNPTTGDYSRGATGLWIENGEIAHPVEEITIAGNLGQMLQDIDAIGSELVWHGRTASPAVRVGRMTVAGQ